MKMFASFVKIIEVEIILEMCVNIVLDFGHCFGVQLVFEFIDLWL
jgi:hypothetical protein